ncbi:hypothetical protein JYT51_00220 [Candidatus Amoebophilus asiaticus]|nr:hypothetical protein [Candidatus Amoebophilus asiaticus]
MPRVIDNMHFYQFFCTCLIILLLKNGFCLAQQLSIPLNKDIYAKYDHLLYENGVNFHSSIKPYLESKIRQKVNYDSILIKRDSSFLSLKKKPGIWKKILHEPLFIVDTANIYLSLSPVFNFEVGKDFSDNKSTYVNSRGLWLTGNLGPKFSFSSSFYENQGIYVSYIDSVILEHRIIPGQGSWRAFKKNGYDYSMASGYISYTPSKYFNFQFGHDKNFIGDGYRSLLLSDISYNYPFLKITTTFWKLKYVNIFTEYQDRRTLISNTMGYQKKYATHHYLNCLIGKRFQIGLFESVIWQSADSTNRRGYDINYLNPVLFYRPVEYGLGSPDNVLMGLNSKFLLTPKAYLYGQFLLDDMYFEHLVNRNGFYQLKYGFQLGIKAYDIFNINGLMVQSEFNQVRPYTYSHKYSLQNYAHYNQPLAHPFGANFQESVSYLSYSFKRIHIELKYLYAQYGDDSENSHYGKNIFTSDFNIPEFPDSYGHYTGQGVNTTLTYKDVRIVYLINPKINLNFELIYSYRTLNSNLKQERSNWLTFGLKTNLSNIYYDF